MLMLGILSVNIPNLLTILCINLLEEDFFCVEGNPRFNGGGHGAETKVEVGIEAVVWVAEDEFSLDIDPAIDPEEV